MAELLMTTSLGTDPGVLEPNRLAPEPLAETAEPPLPRRLPLGAEFLADGTTHFRLWAPRCSRVDLEITPSHESSATPRVIPLRSEEHGYFSARVQGLTPGVRYGFRIPDHPTLLPDPASRSQPDGPEGLSELIDPFQFPWTDQAWRGVGTMGQVLYEMHIGTFTPEGTWEAARRELRELARIGITILEVMPVAGFAGEFNWGYDGVNLFAPTHRYGRPDDFRRFIDQAHAEGLGVILDVVYNHFGPSGNFIPLFSEYFRSEQHSTDWGDGVNFDGRHSQSVREFFVANARHWIEEYHLDGVRFDATQDIHDSSPTHILTELVATIRDAAGSRSTYVVAENEPQDVRMIRGADQQGHDMNAIWNDDFHHAAVVRLTGHNEAYYSDYLGSAEELLAAVKRGFIYQGQRSQWQRKSRGTPTPGVPAASFINFLQNHDQIANSGFGDRIHEIASPGRLRAMTALWLLSPQTPMFFQGQEFGASAPFMFFADWQDEQAQSVAQGRMQFLSQFPSLSTEEVVRSLPSPTRRETFERCKLDLRERESHRRMYDLHVDLLRLRREDPVFRRQDAQQLDGAALGADCLLLRYFSTEFGDRLLLVNFERDLKLSPVSQPLLAPPAGQQWHLVWSSSRPEYGGLGTPPVEIADGWLIPGECAVVMGAVPRP